MRAQKSHNVPTFVLRNVDELRATHSQPVPDTYVKRATTKSF